MREFEKEVLTRLTKIETKLDDYNNTKQKTDDAYNMAKENEKEIDEIKDKLKWITRTVIGAILTGLIGIVFIYLKLGLNIGG